MINKLVIAIIFLFALKALGQNDCKFVYELENSGGEKASTCFLVIKKYSCKFEYPSEAKKNNIQGKVVISAILNDNCELSSILIQKPLGYGLDELAINMLKEFEKQLKNENKTCCFSETKILFPIKFRINK